MATFFPSRTELRRWLAKNHAGARELVVGFYKTHTRRPSITWPDLVKEVLCFGWIDGVRHSLDSDRYTIRITPRKPDSNWSNVNVRLVAELTRLKLMTPAGLSAFAARSAKRTGIYSFENKPKKLPPSYEKPFKANARAWAFFRGQAPWYQRTMAFYVLDAKKEETRLKRLARLIKDSAAGRRVGILERPRKVR